MVHMKLGILYTISKNDVASSVRKRYCALGLRLGLTKEHFRSNVFSSKYYVCVCVYCVYSIQLLP